MEPNAFVAEVYRRMSLRHSAAQPRPTWDEMKLATTVVEASRAYAPLLPSKREAAILDLGFGDGWFIAACLKLGYSDITGADFGICHKEHVKAWSPKSLRLLEIETTIGDFLSKRGEQYDFIHMSHVIEHIPKYSLLWVMDGLYFALKKGGVLLLRTPNMEGICATSSLFVTLAHEYGFCASNLRSLLDICGFEDIRFHRFKVYRPSLKQRLGDLLRVPFIEMNAIRHRLFGVSFGKEFGSELIASGRRGDIPPLLDSRFR